ncbi:uncharacterized protein PV09_02547 [Verruconis gallopava]|uniref:GH64 domain-containing protein n=1 Tax=Verruconis gallopava TaxID=253628 RepID=A0A0D1XVR2_9PEZI|nr:uncharacterized protein PV09_02547 [Verruconis gallopava]KIW06871.1 hypothetical protein PV09_02547 [Verruconis gallopava]
MSTLPVEVRNNTTNNTVWAYVSGYDIDNGNKLLFMAADGKSKYYPPSPPAGQTIQPVPEDCAIKLAPTGQSTVLAIPHIAGCRIWFSTNEKLKFFLNPGPSLVEPSCTNMEDPNINLNWAFCELTYNADQVFCNISMVDFVSNLPCALTLTTTTGRTDHVSGMSINGLANVCRSLKWQAAQDKQPWDKLIFNGPDGQPLRVLSPNNAMVRDPSLFRGYFEPYVNAVYAKHTGGVQLSCDTQAQWGVVHGTVNDDVLYFDGQNIKFPKPSTRDIFSCSTGPFADGSPEQMCIVPRLAAAFNRGTLAISTGGTSSQSSTIPDAAGPSSYYQYETCNHYARIVHEQLLDGRGYGFPYDDVCQTGGPDQCGAVYDSNPRLLTIEIGGNGAYCTPGAPGAPAQ